MNPIETLKLSLKSVMRNRLRSALTVLGIVIGVTSVILLVALVSGLQSFITNQISGLGSNIIFVIPGKIGGGRGPGGTQVNRLTLQDAAAVKSELGSIAEVSASVQKIATIKQQNKSSKDATILGAQGNFQKIIKLLKLDQGRFMTASESNSGKRVAVIGPTVVKNIFPNKNPIGQKIQVGNLTYEVIGTVQPRGSNFGIDQDNVALLPLSAVMKQFGIENIQAIYIATDTPEELPLTEKKVTNVLKKRLSEDDFSVQTQESTLSTISQITGVLTIALGGIAAISLIVGGIGVMNIMLVSVTERTREIGLRKALGARGKDIRNQFLIEAITLSGLGGIIGILLGIGLALVINNFITTTVTLWSVALSFGFSMLVGIIFGVAPAIRASRLDPIQALRYE